MANLFKWKQYESDIIILCIRWYLKFPLLYRNLQDIMAERGLAVVHTTILRWVKEYSPIITKKTRNYLKATNDSWRVDETYVKVKGIWTYLYRAVDSNGDTIDFYLSKNRDKKSAKTFFKKALKSSHNKNPRVITVDKNQSYEVGIPELIYESILNCKTTFRQTKYLKNIVEQDHRAIKRIIDPMMGFKSFSFAKDIISGIEIFHMIKKGQVEEFENSFQYVKFEVDFINNIMGIVA